MRLRSRIYEEESESSLSRQSRCCASQVTALLSPQPHKKAETEWEEKTGSAQLSSDFYTDAILFICPPHPLVTQKKCLNRKEWIKKSHHPVRRKQTLFHHQMVKSMNRSSMIKVWELPTNTQKIVQYHHNHHRKTNLNYTEILLYNLKNGSH
jgi:hypothetical protein